MTTPMVVSYCPRCDESRTAATKLESEAAIREHIRIQEDDLHDNALEQWDDESG